MIEISDQIAHYRGVLLPIIAIVLVLLGALLLIVLKRWLNKLGQSIDIVQNYERPPYSN